MKCKFCGNDLPEESKFCPSCGAPVEPEEKQEQTEQSAEAKQQENQNPYEYGVPGTDNGSGAQNENPYQYGSAEQNNENPYQYGTPLKKSLFYTKWYKIKYTYAFCATIYCM